MSPYFKAKFKGVFKKTKSHHTGSFVHSDFDWKHIEINELAEIHIFDIDAHKTHDYKFYNKIPSRRFWEFGKKTEIFIPIGNDEFFSDTIYNVVIKNIKLTKDESSLLGSDWREANADIYFQLEPKKKIKDVLFKKDEKTNGSNIIDNQNKTESGNLDKRVSGFNDFSESDSKGYVQNESNALSTQEDNNTSIDQTFPISQSIGRSSKWASRLLMGFLFLLLLFYLWNSNKTLFYITAGLGLLWLISRIFNLANIFKFIASLLLIGVIGYFILKLFYDTSTGSTPVVKREGNIKITPPQETDTNGDGRIDDGITGKEINWYDFSNLFYKAKYNTSVAFFKSSISQQSEIKNQIKVFNSSVDFYTQFYNGLYKMDQNKIKEIAKIFSDSASKKNMNATETAEMVITFIQEIPYCLVHEESCQKAIESGDDFMVSYHQQHKPCLPNIIGGVQSPYEFLHNLKGDCDTRSLLGFSILRELNIASSIWVSEIYGHSILGVGVPVGYGIHKEINGKSHYGVELTAKGYRLGMVAPENNNSNNWNITTYFNH